MKKLAVRSSHLALRFYKNDGWTKETVEKLLTKGDLRFFDDRVGDVDLAYWIGNVGSSYDIKLLLDLSDIYHYDGELLKGDALLKYVNYMNW